MVVACRPDRYLIIGGAIEGSVCGSHPFARKCRLGIRRRINGRSAVRVTIVSRVRFRNGVWSAETSYRVIVSRRRTQMPFVRLARRGFFVRDPGRRTGRRALSVTSQPRSLSAHATNCSRTVTRARIYIYMYLFNYLFIYLFIRT